jgi:inositol polyphosphate 5-phosphatase INPP5B/F
LGIRLTILVDHTNVYKLNVGLDKLEDILILHLENGKDFFISVSGKFVPTCFGLDLDMLNNLNEPVLKIQSQLPELYKLVEKNQKGSSANLTGKSAVPPPKGTHHVPKELWRIVDYIYHFGLGVVIFFSYCCCYSYQHFISY